ncbi:MAG: 16S rRNA (adenine(1518)-N(6)/adenine(1519)-N(6))-dimethyltransferase RsmA [Sporichthyaceae bacterium]
MNDGAAGLLGPAQVRELAARLELRPTKALGQNFVIDANTVRRIVRVAEVGADDVVLEVGPGLGSLTLALLPAVARVLAVEIDPRLAAELPRTVATHAPAFVSRLEVLAGDALRIQAAELAAEPTALVANLPYNIAVPVLLHALEIFPSLRRALVMVQSEVADRLAAEPGSRVYGVPSAKARWYGDVRRAGAVSPAVFWPVPRVDSGLVLLTRTAPPTADRAATFAVIDAAFAQRRKMLRSALAGWAGSPAAALAALVAAGVDPAARGESLGIGDFARIAANRPTSG